MEEKILDTIRSMLGEVDEAYNTDLLVLINSSVSTLWQLGIGSPDLIVTEDSTWSEFNEDNNILSMIKNHIYLDTKIIFDPPLSSFVLEAYKKKLDECTWRLREFKEVF